MYTPGMTVKEIAEFAGVSIGTVDRVIYKRGRVSAETKAKVEAIIEKYQFTPNLIARRLKQRWIYKICVFLPLRHQDSGYWEQVLSGIQTAAGEITPLGVEIEIIEFDRYAAGGFEEKARLVLAKDMDGIVFAPIMPERTMPFIKRVQERGVPYIFIDADIPGMSPLCTINQDSFRGGYLAGRLMYLMRGNRKGPAAILDAHGEDYHITRRRDGFLRYARETGMPAIAKEQFSTPGTEFSEIETFRFLKEHPELCGIFITNCYAHRVVEAVKKARGPDDFIIIGFDLIPNNYALLKQGRISAIISQRPDYQGRESLLNLYRHLVLGQKIPAKVEIPLDIFLKENITG
jgi:LacI family transcriptional regulator